MIKIQWQWYLWSEISRDELYALMRLRQEAFSVEQHCAYQDADGLDPYSRHLLGWIPPEQIGGAKILVACARLVPPLCRFDELAIGRVVTQSNYRKLGLGRQLMREASAFTDSVGVKRVRISAQAQLETFYQSTGFATDSLPYNEDGIPHLEMLRLLPESSPFQQAGESFDGLRIEPLREVHAALLFDQLADLSIYQYMQERPKADVAALAKRYARLEQGAPPGCGELWLNWLVTDDKSKQILGTIQATLYPQAIAEIGYAFIPKHWGKGYASTSLRWMVACLQQRWGMVRVNAQVDQRNIGSWKALERAGFVRTGECDETLHDVATRDYLYAVIYPDTTR